MLIDMNLNTIQHMINNIDDINDCCKGSIIARATGNDFISFKVMQDEESYIFRVTHLSGNQSSLLVPPAHADEAMHHLKMLSI